MLYSREFLEAARSRLAPGGVYAQWFHLYETDDEIVELVLRTYASVFPHVSVWLAGPQDLLLLGFDRIERALDVSALEARFHQPDFTAAFARVEIDAFSKLLAHELIPLGTLHAEALEGPTQSLRRPILSDWAARAFFRGRQAKLTPLLSPRHRDTSLDNSLLRRYAGDASAWPEEIFENGVRELCRFERTIACGTFFARWAFDHPESPRLKAVLAELRKNARHRNPAIGPARIEQLQAFYQGPGAGKRDAVTPEEAAELTRLFLDHYHYAAPFDRRAVEAAWDDCRGEGCQGERRRAEASLWGFGDR
jgi:hypothetical protein